MSTKYLQINRRTLLLPGSRTSTGSRFYPLKCTTRMMNISPLQRHSMLTDQMRDWLPEAAPIKANCFLSTNSTWMRNAERICHQHLLKHSPTKKENLHRKVSDSQRLKEVKKEMSRQRVVLLAQQITLQARK